MMDGIWQEALSNGIWTALFLLLLIYQLRDSRKRENKYQSVIERLTQSVEDMEIMKTQVGEISANVSEIKEDINEVKKMSGLL